MVEKHNNYEIMKHRMQAEFASYDMDSISREWDLEREEGALVLTLLGRQYRIDCSSGAVLWECGGAWKEADYNVSMTLFDILSRPRQYPSGEMVPTNALATVHTAAAPGSGFFDRLARSFEGRCGLLASACERLGGVPYGRGDVSYRLPVFKDLSILVRFWDSDEDFGPELSFLCDKNITRFMHFETVMFLLGHVAERIAESAAAEEEEEEKA